mgnify:CR=1 FL=1
MTLPKFSFAAPEHGWMEIAVSFNEDKHWFDVSDGGVDSLDLLVTALLKLLRGSKREEVEWYLEPNVLSWHFEVQGNHLELQICQMEDRHSLFIVSAEKRELINQVARGLEVLEEHPCWTQPRADEVIWSWMFPGDKPHELLREIRNRNRCEIVSK